MSASNALMASSAPGALQHPLGTSELATAHKKLWINCCIGGVYGVLTLIIGCFGIGIWTGMGPLANAFFPLQNINGDVVNTSNIGALISATVAVMACIAGDYGTAIGRTWAAKRTRAGFPLTVNEWRTVAAGGSALALCKTPFLSHGLLSVQVLAMTLMGVVYAGILIPDVKVAIYQGIIQTEIPLANNYGHGSAVSCTDPSTVRQCAAATNMGDIGQGWMAGPLNTAAYQVEGGLMTSLEGFLSTFTGSLGPAHGVAEPETFKQRTYLTVGARFNASCSVDTGFYTDINNRYVLYSACPNVGTIPFGNASNMIGSYGTAHGCISSTMPAYQLEYAIAGSALGSPGSGSAVGMMTMTCIIQGTEGTVNSTYHYGSLTEMSDYSPETILNGQDLRIPMSAVIAALIQDAGLPGKLGIMGLFTSSYAKAQDSGTLAMTLSSMCANAVAAAASSPLINDKKSIESSKFSPNKSNRPVCFIVIVLFLSNILFYISRQQQQQVH